MWTRRRCKSFCFMRDISREQRTLERAPVDGCHALPAYPDPALPGAEGVGRREGRQQAAHRGTAPGALGRPVPCDPNAMPLPCNQSNEVAALSTLFVCVGLTVAVGMCVFDFTTGNYCNCLTATNLRD